MIRDIDNPVCRRETYREEVIRLLRLTVLDGEILKGPGKQSANSHANHLIAIRNLLLDWSMNVATCPFRFELSLAWDKMVSERLHLQCLGMVINGTV